MRSEATISSRSPRSYISRTIAEATRGRSAIAALTTFSYLTDAVRFGAHFMGGLWMVGLSVFAIRGRSVMPSLLAWLGVPIGVIFSANLLVPGLLFVSFMTVPLWLIIVGVAAMRRSAVERGSPVQHRLVDSRAS